MQLALSHACNGQSIECGEMDGVVLGSWPDANESSYYPIEEDNHQAFYWAGAVNWSDAWDQKTVDRVSSVLMLGNSVHYYCHFPLPPGMGMNFASWWLLSDYWFPIFNSLFFLCMCV